MQSNNVGSKKLLIIGEVMTDLHLNILEGKRHLVRLGGIFHAARACDAVGINYGIAYYAPNYLDKDINYFSTKLRAQICSKLGNIDRCPNVMLISESTESGDQGYYDLLKAQSEVIECEPISKTIISFNPTDIIIFPGKYDLNKLLMELSSFEGRIHIDCNYDSKNILDSLKIKIDTIILSTSSTIFKEECKGLSSVVIQYFNQDKCDNILLKENRGGASYYLHAEHKWFESPCFPLNTIHSVGVGDCFDTVFIGIADHYSKINSALRFASFCSSLYASTLKQDDFINMVSNFLKTSEDEINSIQGVRLGWDIRKNKHIYIAAPDFPDVDKTHINSVAESLEYHNFSVHLPVRENGLITGKEDICIQNKAYENDYALLEKCDLLIAVLVYNDPGTLVELGMFANARKPTILYDPYNITRNLFLKKTPNYLCKSLSEVVDATFTLLKRG